MQGGTIAAVGSRATVEATVALPRDVETLDCSGLTITAGFWNSHVHFFERKWADAAAIPAPELGRQLEGMLTRYGFTSVFDLSSPRENTRRLRDRIESGEVLGPRIRTTGEGLIPPDAAPSDQVLNLMGVMKTPLPEVADAAQAAAVARMLIEGGVDGIKLFMKRAATGSRAFPEGAIEATVREAHRAGRPVFVHPNSGADVLAALVGGVDVIAHTTPHSGPWDETILALVRPGGAALTPTLSLWKDYLRHDRISTQKRVVDTGTGQLRAWIAAGGTVLFGTDLGAVRPDPSDEYDLMFEAGMSFSEILASLTTTPAARFGDAGRLGQIAAGFQADLVVLKGDPATDIRALAAVQYTLRAGKVIYKAAG
jgi:imidazolonepropionase-like amidohydrolase